MNVSVISFKHFRSKPGTNTTSDVRTSVLICGDDVIRPLTRRLRRRVFLRLQRREKHIRIASRKGWQRQRCVWMIKGGVRTHSQVWGAGAGAGAGHRCRPPPGTGSPPGTGTLQTPTRWQEPRRTSCWRSWRETEAWEQPTSDLVRNAGRCHSNRPDRASPRSSVAPHVFSGCRLDERRVVADQPRVRGRGSEALRLLPVFCSERFVSAPVVFLRKRLLRDEDESKVDVSLQVLHHHLSPGEATEGVGSVVGVGLSLAAPRPHAHFIQDVFQLYPAADIWRKRSREEPLRLGSTPSGPSHGASAGPVSQRSRFRGDRCFLTTWHRDGVVVTGVSDLGLCGDTHVSDRLRRTGRRTRQDEGHTHQQLGPDSREQPELKHTDHFSGEGRNTLKTMTSDFGPEPRGQGSRLEARGYSRPASSLHGPMLASPPPADGLRATAASAPIYASVLPADMLAPVPQARGASRPTWDKRVKVPQRHRNL